MLTVKQKLGLGILALGVTVIAGYGVYRVMAKPTGPTPAGEVAIYVAQRRRSGVKYLLPEDVGVEVAGKALTGIPAPDMRLSIELKGELVGTYREVASKTYSAVTFGTLYPLSLGTELVGTIRIRPDQIKTLGWSATGYGSFTVRAKILLTNIVGRWEKYSVEVPFTLGLPPTGEIAVVAAYPRNK